MTGRRPLNPNQVARIKRASSLPSFASEEAKRRLKYPSGLKLKGTKTTLAYRVSDEVSVGEEDGGEEYHDAVLRKELFCWILLGRRRIGAMALNTYCFNGCAANEHILETMDLDEDFEAELAHVLCNAWDSVVSDASHMAPVLYFHMAWISPEYADGKLFAVAATRLIEIIEPHSILVMKAYPIEYQGKVPQGSPFTQAARSRQRAMIRYYRRILWGPAIPWPGWQRWVALASEPGPGGSD